MENTENIDIIDEKHYDQIHDFMITTFPDIYPETISDPDKVFDFLNKERDLDTFKNIFSSKSTSFDIIIAGEFKGFIMCLDKTKREVKILDIFSLDNQIATSEMACTKDSASFSLIEFEFLRPKCAAQSCEHDSIVRVLHTIRALSHISEKDRYNLKMLVLKHAGTDKPYQKQDFEEKITEKLQKFTLMADTAFLDFEQAHSRVNILINKHQESLKDLYDTLEDILEMYTNVDPNYGIEKSTYQFMKTKLVTRKIELIKLDLEPYKSFREALTIDIEEMLSLPIDADYYTHMQRLHKILLTARTLKVAHSISQLYVKLASTEETIDIMSLSGDLHYLIDYLISNFGVIHGETLKSSYQYQQIMDILMVLLKILSEETRQTQKKKVASLLEEIVASLKKIIPSADISENKSDITSMVVRLRSHIVDKLMEILSNTDFTLLFKEAL